MRSTQSIGRHLRALSCAMFAAASLYGVAPAAYGELATTQAFLSLLSAEGIARSQIIDIDSEGVPRLCGTGIQGDAAAIAAISYSRNTLPPATRSWACIPSVIRSNGIDVFRLEVNANGPVNGVTLDAISNLLAPPSGTPVTLLDDGAGEDQVEGDGVYTAGPFRFDASVTMPEFYMNDPASPAGLSIASVGTIRIAETDGTESTFLIRPEVGLLRPDLPGAHVLLNEPGLVATSNLINIGSDAHETQRFLRLLGGDLRDLTNRIYDLMPDTFDFLVFLSGEKIERLPRTSSANFIAGIHSRVKTDYTGTGLAVFDATASFGSSGRLLSVNVVDAFSRGLVAANLTHELIHQWASFTSLTLGLSDGTGHYNQRTSAGSLVGGFRWIDHGDGTFTLDCQEGRNGASRASPLDRYMMGLIDPSMLSPLYRNDSINFATDCGEAVTAAVQIEIAEIIALHGERVPGPSSARRAFNVGFVFESHGRLLNNTELTYFDTLAKHFAAPIPGDDPTPRLAQNWPSVRRFFGDETQWFSRVEPFGVPAASSWWFGVLAIALVIAGTVVLRRRSAGVDAE